MPAIQQQPFNKARAITASDTDNFPAGVCDAVVAGGAGDIAAVFPDDTVAVIAVAAGMVLPVTLKRINSTSTTATGLTALYIV